MLTDRALGVPERAIGSGDPTSASVPLHRIRRLGDRHTAPTHRNLYVAAIAVCGAVAAIAAPTAPTGSEDVDTILMIAGALVVIGFGSRAPWWLVALACVASMLIAFDPALTAIAALGLTAALWNGSTRRDDPAIAAAALAVAVNVLARAEVGGFLGLSALVSASILLVLVIVGVRRSPRRTRRVVALVTVLVGGYLVVAVVGFGLAAASSRHDLGAGMSQAELGIAALERRDFPAAAEWLRSASADLERANDRLDQTWTMGAGLVPIVAQHRRAVIDLSSAGADGGRVAADALDQVQRTDLRFDQGRFDVGAIAALEAPLVALQQSLDHLRADAVEARSVWLVGRATRELDDFDVSIGEHAPTLERTIEAVRVAPDLLGHDGTRRYLTLFTTPSESRGLGGMIGGYGELTVEDGRLSLERVGRAEDLDHAALEAGATVHGHEEFLAQYGRFGYDGGGTARAVVGEAGFRNLAMSPDFPTVAEIAADLYEQTTGRTVDGAISMDPFALGRLMSYAGPIELSNGQVLDADHAVQYLLRDQYIVEDDKSERSDSLAEAAGLAFDALQTSRLPPPLSIASDLEPLAHDGRLLMWSTNADEQALLSAIDLGGALPTTDGANGWAVTINNSGGNKIDSFVERRASFETETDDQTGLTTSSIGFQVTNNAPPTGLPAYVIGNRVGLPAGTSRSYVSFYSPLALSSATLDGAPIGLAVGAEGDWNVYSGYVDIPAGESRRFQLELAGRLARPLDDAVSWTQPLAEPLRPLDD